MSKEYDNTNTGVMFKNDVSGKSENFPPYGGTINVEGVEYWISAWVKDGQKGKFFSFAIKPKEARQEQRSGPRRDEFSDNGRKPAPSFDAGIPDSDIPF